MKYFIGLTALLISINTYATEPATCYVNNGVPLISLNVKFGERILVLFDKDFKPLGYGNQSYADRFLDTHSLEGMVAIFDLVGRNSEYQIGFGKLIPRSKDTDIERVASAYGNQLPLTVAYGLPKRERLTAFCY